MRVTASEMRAACFGKISLVARIGLDKSGMTAARYEGAPGLGANRVAADLFNENIGPEWMRRGFVERRAKFDRTRALAEHMAYWAKVRGMW